MAFGTYTRQVVATIRNGADNCWLLAGAGIFLCALLVIYPLSDFDTFWHLADGRAMLE